MHMISWLRGTGNIISDHDHRTCIVSSYKESSPPLLSGWAILLALFKEYVARDPGQSWDAVPLWDCPLYLPFCSRVTFRMNVKVKGSLPTYNYKHDKKMNLWSHNPVILLRFLEFYLNIACQSRQSPWFHSALSQLSSTVLVQMYREFHKYGHFLFLKYSTLITPGSLFSSLSYRALLPWEMSSIMSLFLRK